MATKQKHHPAFEAVQVKKGVRGFIGGDRPIEKSAKGIRLYEDQVEPFEQACKDAGLTKVDLVRHLVDMYLNSSPQETNAA